jgi:hypothetical protein
MDARRKVPYPPEAEIVIRENRVVVEHLNGTTIADRDMANAGLAAALIAHFEERDINPDPDIWQMLSDSHLEQVLGRNTFEVLNRRRETMIQWMTILLHAQ